MGIPKKKYDRTFRGKLSNQLIVSFIGMFLVVLLVSMAAAYYAILGILKNNSKENGLNVMSQYNYNLNTFHNEMNHIFRQMVFPNQAGETGIVQRLITLDRLPEVERTVLLYAGFQSFKQLMSNYSYIRSINFYSDEGTALSASREANQSTTETDGDGYRFYQNILRKSAISDPGKLVWLGGYGEREFDLKGARRKQAVSKPYITAVRSFFSGSKAGVIAINVDLDYFTSIYNRAGSTQTDRMYMVDSTGMIVSHNDPSRIGQRIDIQNLLESGLLEGSPSASLERDGQQMMAYRVDGLDWILILEVPLSIFVQDAGKIRTIALATLFASLAFAILLSQYWIRRLTLPLVRLTAAIRKVKAGKLGATVEIRGSHNELGILIDQFNLMSSELANVIEQKEKIEEEKRTIEVQALQTQINPHLIYNTLNTIKWMAIMIKANNIAESITALSDILEPLFKKQQVLCTIEEELDYIHPYIKIMRFRYGGSFKVEISVPEDMLACRTLRFILQPIVENAIYHGLSGRQGGCLSVSGEFREGTAVLTVRDDGEGFTESKLSEVRSLLIDTFLEEREGQREESGSGIGLWNVQRRIRLHFGERYGIVIDSLEGYGTEVRLTLPGKEMIAERARASN
ncbi:sensor histidine kinase [Paenibacillus sp. GCM10027626]|uniref:cache domain-containing sensor histidine kinase n=1 Tax=Paenibacillus sp. GCM10027626 TaxID=3273411 RepID=UPI00362D0D95